MYIQLVIRHIEFEKIIKNLLYTQLNWKQILGMFEFQQPYKTFTKYLNAEKQVIFHAF